MKLSFAQPAYIYSNTDLSIESPYAFIASEGVVQHCSQQFSVITQKSFKLFKLKKSYAGAQIIVPVSEKTLDYMNMINMYIPIGAYALNNQNYKFAEHIRQMNEVLEPAIQLLPTRINTYQLSDQNYIGCIAPILENILNAFKRFSTSTLHMKDMAGRKLWMSDQLKSVMALFRKVYNKEQRANLVVVTVNHLTLNIAHLTQDEIERKISIQAQQVVCELFHENEQGVFHLFHRTYRDLSGAYYTQIFVITDRKLIFTTNSILLDPNQSAGFNSAIEHSTYMFKVNADPLDIHGLDGFDQECVKQSFQQFLSSHLYLYYHSKEISPDIIIVK